MAAYKFVGGHLFVKKISSQIYEKKELGGIPYLHWLCWNLLIRAKISFKALTSRPKHPPILRSPFSSHNKHTGWGNCLGVFRLICCF